MPVELMMIDNQNIRFSLTRQKSAQRAHVKVYVK